MSLQIRPSSECQFDQVSLGEVMLRLDQGEGRIRTTRSFKAWEGGRRIQYVPRTAQVFRLQNGGRDGVCG